MAALVAALALASCGGESENEQIINAIHDVATLSDPENCEALETPRFLAQTQRRIGSAGTEACEEEVERGSGAASSVEVSRIRIEGDSASAQAKFNGGNYDGQALELRLARENGTWKLDAIVGFAEVDRPKLVALLRRQLPPELGLKPAQRRCIERAIAKASNAELEAVVASLTPSPELALAGGCL